jgi:hypothetical protein
MNNSSRQKCSPKALDTLLIIVFSILFGLAGFLLLYGHFTLHFKHVNWIYSTGRDLLQHQLGWEFFRNEPWRFPLGTIQAYGYPIGTSVTYLDSIPLFAFFFKLLSHWLPKNFQYFGLWELTSVIGQMLLGMLILKEFTRSWPARILGACLLVLSPTMIYRAFFHNSLSAQWIILAAIWFVILEYRHKLWHWAWLFLFALAMLIHLYFVPMIMPLWIISLYFHYSGQKKRWPILIDILAVVAVIFVIGYCTGIFAVSAGEIVLSVYGNFSWNLNGFFNPDGFSKILKGLPLASDGQEEGFSYLGLGNLILIPLALLLFLVKDRARKNLKVLLPFGIVSLGYLLFAASNTAFFNTTPIWNIPLSTGISNILDLFRASARFIWPVFYFLVLFGLIAVARNIRHPELLLLPILLIQFFDIQPLYSSKRVKGYAEYTSKMQDSFWSEAAKTNKSIVIIPTEYYEQVVLYADKNHMTVNSGYFARADYNAMEANAQQVWNDLLAGKSDSHTLYLLSQPKYADSAAANLSKSMYLCNFNDYTVLFSKENEVTKTVGDLESRCTIPNP